MSTAKILGCLRSRRGLNINDFVEDGVIKEVVSLLGDKVFDEAQNAGEVSMVVTISNSAH